MNQETYTPFLEGLSYSALLDLRKSAFRFWRKRLDPDKPEKKQTAAMLFGDVFHVMTLEPDKFDQYFCMPLDPADYPDALDTGDQYKKRCSDLNLKVTGNKTELKERILAYAADTVFLDDLYKEHGQKNHGKKLISLEMVNNAKFLSKYVNMHPDARRFLNSATAKREFKVKWTNRFGIPMRGKIDLFDKVPGLGNVLVELKTFSNPQEKSIDDVVVNKFAGFNQAMQLAIYDEAIRYQFNEKVDYFVTIFAETGDIPHVILRANEAGSLPLIQGHQMYEETCRKFLAYHQKFGLSQPWIDDAQALRVFQDEEFPVWIFNN